MKKERVVFFNVNGSGLGHMNRCLAYARQLQERMQPVFFSLASAIDIIEEMGFEAEYFVSHYWSADSTFSWNSELAIRFGMMLERVQPSVIVFDGTWPFQGFMAACTSYGGSPALVWSNRGLLKADAAQVNVDEGAFNLIIQPGELGSRCEETSLPGGGRRMRVPPVCLLDNDELFSREAARQALGFSQSDRLALFSLGPGNLKDVSSIGHHLVTLFEEAGFTVVWTQAPITIQDVQFPPGVKTLSLYPLVRYMRAFDVFVGAAGYNTCCELVQAQIPSLLIPNTLLADDQSQRAQAVAENAPVVVSACESDQERHQAMNDLLACIQMQSVNTRKQSALLMNGAHLAADAIAQVAHEAKCNKAPHQKRGIS